MSCMAYIIYLMKSIKKIIMNQEKSIALLMEAMYYIKVKEIKMLN